MWPALRSLQEMEIHYGFGTGVTAEAAGRPLPYPRLSGLSKGM